MSGADEAVLRFGKVAFIPAGLGKSLGGAATKAWANPRMRRAIIGAGVGAGTAALAGGDEHRGRNMALGALAGGGLGYMTGPRPTAAAPQLPAAKTPLQLGPGPMSPPPPGKAGPQAGPRPAAAPPPGAQSAPPPRGAGPQANVPPRPAAPGDSWVPSWAQDAKTKADVQRAYKTQARAVHPDLGGSTAAFQAFQAQNEAMRAHPDFNARFAHLMAKFGMAPSDLRRCATLFADAVYRCRSMRPGG